MPDIDKETEGDGGRWGRRRDLGNVKKHMVELGKHFSHLGLGLLSSPDHEGPVQDERGCRR